MPLETKTSQFKQPGGERRARNSHVRNYRGVAREAIRCKGLAEISRLETDTGMYRLQAALDATGFDPAADRLFSVGDLLDRALSAAMFSPSCIWVFDCGPQVPPTYLGSEIRMHRWYSRRLVRHSLRMEVNKLKPRSRNQLIHPNGS
jgi:hypothetical protein